MRTLALIAFALCTASACSDSTSGGTDAGSTADTGSLDTGMAEAVEVVACPASGAEEVNADFSTGFSPAETSISIGDIVKFISVDAAPHTITERADGAATTPLTGGFSFDVPAGGNLCLRFNEPGTVAYMCTIHTTMRGTVTVSGGI